MAIGRKVKIPVIGTVGKTVFIDPTATRGATLGMDVFTPDGRVGTPNTVREWLGLTLLSPPGVEEDTAGGTQHHRLLQGLKLGDDHPQYTQWVQDEDITGQWDFQNITRFADGSAATPSLTFIADPNTGIYRLGIDNFGFATAGAARWDINTARVQQNIPLIVRSYAGIWVSNPDFPSDAGIQLTTESGPNPLADGVGNTLAFWETGTGGDPPTPFSVGFRFHHDGTVVGTGDLNFYRHHGSVPGVLMMKIARAASQFLYASGSALEPVLSHIGDDNCGIYFPANDQIGFAMGGGVRMIITASLVDLRVPLHAENGSAAGPSISFSGDTNTGLFLTANNSNTIGFTAAGARRAYLSDTETAFVHSVFLSPSTDTPQVLVERSLKIIRTNSPNIRGVAYGSTGTLAAPAALSSADNLARLEGAGYNGTAFAVGGAVTFQAVAGWTVSSQPTRMLVQTTPAGSTTLTERFRIEDNGAWGLGGANYGTAGHALLSSGSSAAPTWQPVQGFTTLTPAQITATQNDYSPADLATAGFLRVSSDASRNVTGLATGAEGRWLIITNVGSFPIVLQHENTGSSAANRFLFDDGADLVLGTEESQFLRYDPTSARWRTLKDAGSSGGSVNAIVAGTGIAVDATDPTEPIVSVDINGLTADATPVGSTDYVMTYDASAATLKKVLLDNLPGAGGGTVDTIVPGDGIAVDDSDPANPIVSIDTATLASEILADNPVAYWKLDEASGNFADSSGNSRTLTAVGSPSYQYGAWVPRETTRFVYFDASGDHATRTDQSGLSIPASADWTFECIAVFRSFTTNESTLFAIGASGETEAANYQILAAVNTGALINNTWEFGAGTNESQVSVVGTAQPLGMPMHLALVKNGTANTVTIYRDGQIMDIISYSNEPTGGTSATTDLHGNVVGGTTNPVGMAHVALYNSALSQARIRAHARAAGFLPTA